MAISLKTKYLFVVLLVLFGALFFVGYRIGHSRGESVSTGQINALKGTIHSYQVMIADTKTYVSKVEQEVTTLKQAVKNDEVEKKELRTLNIKQANEINHLKLRIDTLLEDVVHNGQIIDVLNSQIANDSIGGKADKDTISARKAILLPFTFSKQDEWLNLSGSFSSVGKLDIGLKLDFKVDLWAGIDKTTKTNKALFTTNCPYIGVVSFNSIKLDTPKKKNYAFGLSAGYGATFQSGQFRASPFLGVCVTRILWSF